ncbi:MAG: inorganic phosphate transporter [Euryarchaeota archaeon]|nr:inorganic phosphate transporter [Euryarchaeota archaeon]
MAFGFEYILFIILVALIFDFFNGMNDSANSTATIIATRVLKPIYAVALAAVFNFLGPVVGGLAVAKTIGKGILATNIVTPDVVLGALIGGIAWTWFATHYGIPISVSHSLVGGLLGAGFGAASLAGWVLPKAAEISPAFTIMRDGAIVGALLALLVALATRARGVVVQGFLGAFLGSGLWLTAKIFLGTAKVTGLFATVLFIFYSPMIGFVGGYLLSLLIMWLFRWAKPGPMTRMFGILQLLSSSFYSFSHGKNDGQKTMGILMALTVAAGWYTDAIYETGNAPLWIILGSAGAIALGTMIGGYRVVHTMGMKLTHLEPRHGFAAETASAFGLFMLAEHGVPVSTTHSITGSIMGVGAVRGHHHVRWGTVRTIVSAWIITIPASALVAWASFLVVRAVVRWAS